MICCARSIRGIRSGFVIALLCIAGAPQVVVAQVAGFAFVSDPQTIAAGAISEQITLQSQGSDGASVPVPSTACIAFTSTSATGQFSSSATNWSSVSVLTMSKNTANKNLYYKDATAGGATLTARIALKPESVSSACASWPQEEWSVSWTATQNISIGTASGQVASSSSATTTPPAASSSSGSGEVVSSYVAPPLPELFADGGSDRMVIVGADTVFNARAYDRSREYVDHVRFSWNFGDGSTAEGQSVSHRFAYPGKYAVVLSVAAGVNSASDRVIVTAEPARLAFAVFPDGSAAIENSAGRDLDLSHWIVRHFSRAFMLPEHTLVLAGTSLRLPQSVLGFWSGKDTELAYPNGALVLRAGESSAGSAEAPHEEEPAIVATGAPVVAASHPLQRTLDVAPETEYEDAGVDESDTSTAQVASVARAVPSSSLWWYAAAGVSLLGAAAAVASRRFTGSRWRIIEERDE